MNKALTFSIIILTTACFTACKKSSVAPGVTSTAGTTTTTSSTTNTSLYFPPVGTNDWVTTTPASLGWNTANLTALYPYLNSKGTKAFIILKNGKIVLEQYFGTFTADSLWYWDSAGKTMTGLLVGIAQQQGLININNPTSQYIGAGWTSEPPAKEILITIKNQLTMTSGIDDAANPNDLTLPSALLYKADAGTRWAYDTGVYTVLDQVIASASKTLFTTYFQQKISGPIGMTGTWIKIPNANNIYYSNARSMARFGLLMLNKGNWNGTPVLSDTTYFNAQVNTSQNFNLSYGYLTWLNGKASSMLPQSQVVYPTSIIPNAPADLYAALGKNDQKIYVVPSQNLVIIRMGNTAGAVNLAGSDFDNELWGMLSAIITH